MYTLGINGGISWLENNKFNLKESQCHDAAAVLLKDGKPVAAFEEERLNRIKHTNKLPVLAIAACLKTFNIKVTDLDAIVIAAEELLLDSDIRQLMQADSSFNYLSARDFIIDVFKNELGQAVDSEQLHFVNHHLAHAASSYFLSGHDDSLVIAIDGSGDNRSGGVYIAKGNDIKQIEAFAEDDSIGHFYLAITRLLGFKRFDEYKVMGLAPYGDPEKFENIFNSLYHLGPDGSFSINKKLMEDLPALLPSREPRAEITQEHKDVAAALQVATERLVFHIVAHYKLVVASPNLCLCGGVALNCTMTGKLKYAGLFKDIFVQPASHDGGLSLGAALWLYYQRNPAGTKEKLSHLYLGSECPSPALSKSNIDKWKNFVSYEVSQDITGDVAALLANDKIIGWFQGRSEYGPRALGNRSILGDPRPTGNKARINKCIKNREGFRPFAPSVMVNHAREIFNLPDNVQDYPYMTFILTVNEQYQSKLGAVTHVDGTARVQTVSKTSNPLYYNLIKSFYKKTGMPVILNTSFNNNHEPIVDTPDEAIGCFLTTELDALVIGNCILNKVEFLKDDILTLHLQLPKHITLLAFTEDDQQVYKLGNTYNSDQYTISHELYTLLSSNDQSKKIGELISDSALDHNTPGLVGGLWNLWNKRVVVLLPPR